MGKITKAFSEINKYFEDSIEKYHLITEDPQSSEFGFYLINEHVKIIFESEYYYDTVLVNIYRKENEKKYATITGLLTITGKLGKKYNIQYPKQASSELSKKLYFNLFILFNEFNKILTGDFSEWDSYDNKKESI